MSDHSEGRVMNVCELHAALERQIANGDFQVTCEVGNGQMKPCTGYEVMTSAAYVVEGSAATKELKSEQEFRLTTVALF